MKVKHQLGSPCSVYPVQDGTVPCWDCNKYEGEFQASGGIKLFLQGTGKDSHIEFSEPETSPSSRPRIKTVAYDTILANARFLCYCTTSPL